MLIFGGMTSRDRLINGTKLSLFDQCEYYDLKYGLRGEERP